MTKTIYTRADGTPIEQPEPPGAGATIDQRIGYLRELMDFHDEVRDVASDAFAKAFAATPR